MVGAWRQQAGLLACVAGVRPELKGSCGESYSQPIPTSIIVAPFSCPGVHELLRLCGGLYTNAELPQYVILPIVKLRNRIPSTTPPSCESVFSLMAHGEEPVASPMMLSLKLLSARRQPVSRQARRRQAGWQAGRVAEPWSSRDVDHIARDVASNGEVAVQDRHPLE